MQQPRQNGGDQSQNRYAHLVAGTNSRGQPVETRRQANASEQVHYGTPTAVAATSTSKYPVKTNHSSSNSNGRQIGDDAAGNGKSPHAPPLGAPLGDQQRNAYAHYYYNSFSSVDWREQWIILKERLLEKVEEPRSQRRLILFIVCCALLLDNMLYMVIVPIIPDYLRSIGAWSTYTENAKWIRRNTTHGGAPKWERVGGQVVYEGEDSAVGFLFASKAIVQLIINPFSGTIIDRIGYEIPMMIGLIVMFFSTMVFACGQTYSVLFLARSLQGVGSAFADTSGLAMIADRFTEENERQRALGVALAFISFGCLVAPPFGSVLYQGAGKEVPFIILSLVCLLDGSLLLLVTPPGTFAQLLPSLFSNNRPGPQYPAKQAQPSAAIVASPRQQQQHQLSQESTTSLSSPLDNRKQRSVSIEDCQQSVGGAPMDERRNMKSGAALRRQKSISRRHSMTVASAGEAPKGTPIYVLFRDPCIACCAGALVVANVSLAFLEPTISIWVQNTMPDIEEWQMGMIWLPAFVPHVLGVYSTVKLADKYPRYQWLIAAIGLVLEGLSCLMVPFCTSFWSLIIPISIICFGLALIDTAILPTLGFLVDTRYVSVYGSIYAIADISYSLSYAIGPIIAGGIVEAIGFAALNVLIAIVTLGYTPILMMLRTIHDYEPFEADQSGLRKKQAKELAPFGKFGRPIREEDEEEDEPAGPGAKQVTYGKAAQFVAPEVDSADETDAWRDDAQVAGAGNQAGYKAPAWADNVVQQQPAKPSLSRKVSIKMTSEPSVERRKQNSVKIVGVYDQQHSAGDNYIDGGQQQQQVRNPFAG